MACDSCGILSWKAALDLEKILSRGFLGESFLKIPVSARKSMLNYELRLLDTHDPKVEKALKDKAFKSRGFLNTLKEIWFLKADKALLNTTISLFDNWSGDRDDLMLSLGDYLWASVPGMTEELWGQVERIAVEKGIFLKGGYMNIREHIKEEGIQKGLQEGMQKGMQKGRLERNREVVLNMLQKKLDTSLISEVTGLSEKEVESFKNRTE